MKSKNFFERRKTTSIVPGFETILGSLSKELTLLEKNILNDIQTEVELLNTVAKHILLSGGKRLRPALVMLGASIFSGIGDSIQKAAQIVEYLHTGTLLHDDVVDGAEIRRTQKAARKIWGNEASVLTGDYLLSKAFQMLTGLKNLEVLKLMSNTTTLMAEGEILQLKSQIGLVDEEQYLKIIYYKTACLFGAAVQCGGILAGANSDQAKTLKRYGEAVGMAFQIVDDALDYNESEKTGKKAGTDFLERKFTMPLIHLISNVDDTEKNCLMKMLNDPKLGFEKIPYVINLMKEKGSIEYSLDRAGDYVNSAVKETSLMHSCKEVDTLRQVAQYIILRHC